MSSFRDFQDYLGLPRLSGLALSPDGARLVVSVAEPDAERARFVTALWEVDPAGERPARPQREGRGRGRLHPRRRRAVHLRTSRPGTV